MFTSLPIRHGDDEMTQVRARVLPTDHSADALALMNREDLSFVIVVAGGTGELLGVVLKSVLENACASAGHDPVECRVRQHLKADVRYSFQDTPGDELLNQPEGVEGAGHFIRSLRARSRQRLPVIVVDRERVPVGLRDRET